MTVTYLALSGNWEDIDVIVANLLNEDWVAANTNNKEPEIRSGGSSPTNRRAGPTRKNHTDQVRVKTVGHNNDEENSDSSKTHNRMSTNLEIKIETDNKNKAESYMREINRILLEAHPNSGVRILKVDNAASQILYFSPPMPNWTTNIPDVLNTGKVIFSGMIAVEWAVERS